MDPYRMIFVVLCGLSATIMGLVGVRIYKLLF